MSARRVLVTGGGSGIGRDIARAFADRGDTVTVAGRRFAALQETDGGRGIATQIADVTDEASVAALFDSGPFEVVVANAGGGVASAVVETELGDWSSTLAVNLTGVFLVFRAALRAGMAPGGRLIAMASTAGLQGGARLSAYSAAKHGVLGLVKSVALEVARKDITCNAICPGFVDTDLATTAIDKVMETTGASEDEARARVTSRNPMRRLIAPEEVTAAALFLASSGASMVNGHALSVSGGEI